GVLHLGASSEDAVDDLGVDAVAVHVLDPQMRVARPAQTLFEIVAVEARLGHLVGAQLLARDMRRAGRADAATQAVFGAVIVGPALHAVRILGDVGHQIPELARRVRGEQVGRQPEHVEMTIRRDTLVLPSHHRTSLDMDRNWRTRASVEPAVTLSQVLALFLAITGSIFARLACGGVNAVQFLAVQLLVLLNTGARLSRKARTPSA